MNSLNVFKKQNRRRLLKQEAVLLLLIIYIFSWPFINQSFMSGYDFKRLSELFVLSISLCLLMAGNVSIPRTFSHIWWVIVLIVALAIVSILLSESKRYAVIELSLFILLCSFSYTVLALSVKTSTHFFICISTYLMVTSTVYIVGVGAGYLASQIEGFPLRWSELFLGYTNVRFFNQFQVWTFPFLTFFYMAVLKENRRYKLLGMIVVSLWWTLLFLSGSRGAMIASIAAILVTLFVYKKMAIEYFKLNVLFAVIGLILFNIFFNWLPMRGGQDTILVQLNSLSSSTRIELWLHALELIKQSPWFGVGPMHYAWYPGVLSAHPHNSLIQISTEWGLPLLICILYLVCYSSFKWQKRFCKEELSKLDSTDRLITISLLCSCLSGALYSLVSGVIVMPQSQMMAAIVIGIMLAHYRKHSRSGKSVLIDSFLWKNTFAIILIGLIWYCVWPSLMLRLDNEIDLTMLKTVHPRFWQIGGIPHN